MKTIPLTARQQRSRKALLVLPLIVCIFTTLLFWTLGGGAAPAAKANTSGGLSMKLPAAILGSEQTGDKMSFYDRAQADSQHKEQLRRTDPNTIRHLDPAGSPAGFSLPDFSPHQPPGASFSGTAEDEAKISQRLSQLQAVISKPAARPELTMDRDDDIKRDTCFRVPATTKEDPELKQMNGLLEKILEIQHPERQQLTASTAPAEKTAIKKFRAIPAVVEGTQKIVQGTVIRMKLLDTVTLGGQLYPKGQFVFGSGTLAGQRYTLNIKSIRVGYNFFPVDLTVFDLRDGQEGISVPEAITADALRGGAVSGVQNMDLMSFDPSVTAQLTTAGINTAKGLFSKKVRQVKGKLKDGHPLLLRDNSSLRNNHQ